MSSLSSPWYQQKHSQSSDSLSKQPSLMSPAQQQALTARLCKPTQSARYRRALCWKIDSFMDAGKHSWTKMRLFEDCKKCLWTPSGSIKTRSCKIRPINFTSGFKRGPAPGL